MPGISVHVIDVTRGLPAAGLVVEVDALDGGPGGRTRIGGGPLSPRGTLEDPGLAAAGRGLSEAVFHVGDFSRGLGDALPDPPFLDAAPFRVGIAGARVPTVG